MAHKHSVYDTDAHFIINPITREITNGSTSKVTVIQHDHNSERFTFEISRFVDGHDMSACDRVEVHYINMDSADPKSVSADIYEVNDLQVSPDGSDRVICSWLLSRNATKYAGSLNFLVRFVCLDGGNVAYAWHTAIFTGISVSNGIMNSAEEIVEPFPDVLAQWKADLFGVGDTEEQRLLTVSQEQQAAIAAKGAEVLDSIPDEYEALQTGVDTLFNSVASGIRGSMSGAIVTADDVSSVEHEMSVNVRSKNEIDLSQFHPTDPSSLIPYITAVENNSITIYSPEGVYGHKATEVTLRVACPNCKVGKTYILTAESPSKHQYIYLNGVNAAWYYGKTKILTDEMLDSTIVLYGYNTQEGDPVGECTISNIQIEEGETATDYEPYINPANVTLTRCGKNLIPFPYVDGGVGATYTNAGITYKVNADKSITANGTATTNSYFRLCNIGFGESYIYENNTSGEFSCLDCQYDDGNQFAFIMILRGATVTNRVYHPQIERGAKCTDWESPKGRVDYTPAADGTVPGITSLSPCMTILTDTDGAIVECEYNIDTKTYIDNKIAALLSNET